MAKAGRGFTHYVRLIRSERYNNRTFRFETETSSYACFECGVLNGSKRLGKKSVCS